MGIISDFPWGMEHRRPHSDSSSLWKSKIGAERGGECALLVVDGRRRKIAETSEGPRYDDVTPWGESASMLKDDTRNFVRPNTVVTRLEVMRIPFPPSLLLTTVIIL